MKLVNPTDDELSAAVAEHVAKIAHLYTLMKRGLYYRVNAAGYTSRFEDAWKVTEDVANQHAYPGEDAVTKHRVKHPPYATSADAVLPLLDGFMWVGKNTLDCGRFAEHLSNPNENGRHSVKIINAGKEYVSIASTFPRAACIALLRANGVELVIQ